MKSFQLQIPTLNKTSDYTFPYWVETDRVIGQPVNDMLKKYEASYSRVAATMIKIGPHKFSNLNMMGLFATSYRTIPDYLQFKFKQQNLNIPLIDKVTVVERDPVVCSKIKLDDQTNVINSQFRNLIYSPYTSSGKPPAQALKIYQFQKQHRNKINFIDIDLMCNWSRKEEFNYFSELINIYRASACVVHINAIKKCDRAAHLRIKEKHIPDILDRVLAYTTGQIKNVSINSYKTSGRVKTEMTSVVFSIE